MRKHNVTELTLQLTSEWPDRRCQLDIQQRKPHRPDGLTHLIIDIRYDENCWANDEGIAAALYPGILCDTCACLWQWLATDDDLVPSSLQTVRVLFAVHVNEDWDRHFFRPLVERVAPQLTDFVIDCRVHRMHYCPFSHVPMLDRIQRNNIPRLGLLEPGIIDDRWLSVYGGHPTPCRSSKHHPPSEKLSGGFHNLPRGCLTTQPSLIDTTFHYQQSLNIERGGVVV